jgi:hypothetical protein
MLKKMSRTCRAANLVVPGTEEESSKQSSRDDTNIRKSIRYSK